MAVKLYDVYYYYCINIVIDIEKVLAQSNVNTAGSSDAQLSGCQEQQADVTELIPDANSSNNISVPSLTDTNAGISSDNVPTPHSNLEASPSLLDNAAGGI